MVSRIISAGNFPDSKPAKAVTIFHTLPGSYAFKALLNKGFFSEKNNSLYSFSGLNSLEKKFRSNVGLLAMALMAPSLGSIAINAPPFLSRRTSSATCCNFKSIVNLISLPFLDGFTPKDF